MKSADRAAKVAQEPIEAVPSSLPELEAPSSPLSTISAHDSSLSPVSSDMPSPIRTYPRRGIAAPSPLHQSTSRASPSSLRPSRKRRLSADTQEAPTRPAKVSRSAPTKRQSRQSARMEVDAFLAGEDETLVEGLISGAEEEDLTPIPGEIVGQESDQAVAEIAADDTTSVEREEPAAAASQEGQGEEEDERFPPGTLGAYCDCAYDHGLTI